jgi:hypothetical protein
MNVKTSVRAGQAGGFLVPVREWERAGGFLAPAKQWEKAGGFLAPAIVI